MTRIIRSAGLFISGQSTLAASVQTLLISITILAINVLTGVITARFLGVSGRGEQEAMGVWPLFLAGAFTLGLPSSLVFNLKKTPDDGPKIFSSAMVSALLAGLLALLIGYIFVPLWLEQHTPQVIGSAKLLMLFAPAVLMDNVFSAALTAKGSFGMYNFIRFLRPSATVLALLILALCGWLTPFRACLCYLLPSLPISAWLLHHMWRSYRPVWRGLRTTFKRVVSYGLRSYGIDILGTLSLQIDKALVVGLLSASSMGFYVVALNLANMLNVFQSAASTVLFPKATGRSTEEVVALAGRTARISSAITLIAALVLGLLGPWALEFLYGPEFRGGANLMRLLILVTTFEGTASVLAQAFMATNRPGLITARQAIGVFLNFPLLLLLVPRFGLMGAGVSLLITSFLRLLFILIAFPSVLKVPVPRLWLNIADIRELLDTVRAKRSVR